ncbi:hypothetical protein [Paenisporosarcina sp. TG-14]|uniref:hypothetical protein n=1 Tax=Paenisporosarcina sp. TG-14 TaxID=1231057 RepID=UPI00037C1A68|nr:hypothetical protein [Paenisporosarcina sp. TG-14]
MGIWAWPLVFVIFIISAIGFYATWRIMVFDRKRQEVNDSPIPQTMKDHPFVLNPIIWVYLTALVFVTILIAYYVASSPY